MIDREGRIMNRESSSALLRKGGVSLISFKGLFSCLKLISVPAVLMISASCEMLISDSRESPGDNFSYSSSRFRYPHEPKESPGENFGYANSTFRYFYYPEDRKIYYISGNAVHRMDVDGRNSTVIKSNAWKDLKDPSSIYPFIFVSEDTVYYNDGRLDGTTYRMNTDGTEHAAAHPGKSGPMGEYETEDGGVLYFDGRQQYWEDDTRYFSNRFDNLSRQTPEGTVTALTNGQAGNFVLTPDGIYLRLRTPAGTAGAYGIVKVDYDAVPRGSGDAARLGDADMRRVVDAGADDAYQASEPNTWVILEDGKRINFYHYNTLNVSDDFVAYIRRSIDNTPAGGGRILPGGLNVMNRKGDEYSLPRTIRAGLNKFDVRDGGGIDIIGDYVYWLTEDKDNQRYELHRIRKDGTGYGVVKDTPY